MRAFRLIPAGHSFAKAPSVDSGADGYRFDGGLCARVIALGCGGKRARPRPGRPPWQSR